jgi:hypothetical protein
MRKQLTILLLAPSLAWAQSAAPPDEKPAQVIGPFSAAPIAMSPATPGKDPLGLGSGPIAKPPPFEFNFGTAGGRTSAGVGVGLAEGKPLEVMIWGGGGAIAGAMVGPVGAIVGAGAGALLGLLYSVFVVPHNGPGKDEKARRGRGLRNAES